MQSIYFSPSNPVIYSTNIIIIINISFCWREKTQVTCSFSSSLGMRTHVTVINAATS